MQFRQAETLISSSEKILLTKEIQLIILIGEFNNLHNKFINFTKMHVYYLIFQEENTVMCSD